MESIIYKVLYEISIYSICIRLFLSMIIGGILGLERGFKNRPAGFRTYILVCMGSTIIMMTNQYIYEAFQNTDPARLAAQVVSGIGFLGAGTIVLTKNSKVKGLTTAAGLWVAAGLGLAIGIGFYEGAIVGGIGIFFVMTFLHKIDDYIHSHAKSINLYIEYDNTFSLSSLQELLQQNQLDIYNIQMDKAKRENEVENISFSMRLKDKMEHITIIDTIGKISGVRYIEET